jgi:hypothetical protein
VLRPAFSTKQRAAAPVPRTSTQATTACVPKSRLNDCRKAVLDDFVPITSFSMPARFSRSACSSVDSPPP